MENAKKFFIVSVIIGLWVIFYFRNTVQSELLPASIIRGASSSTFTRGAFCDSHIKKLHPSSPPLEPHLPWPWDASIKADTNGKYIVEVIVMPLSLCQFDRAKWHEICRLYPFLAKDIANCDTQNIIVNVDTRVDFSPLNGQYMQCVYTKFNTERVSVRSQIVILGRRLIRCPLPDVVTNIQFWKLHFEMSSNAIDSFYESNNAVANWTRNRTEAFRVCPHVPVEHGGRPHIPPLSTRYRDDTIYQNQNRSHKSSGLDAPSMSNPQHAHSKRSSRSAFTLTACTATLRSDPMQLTEWLLYHQHMGIEHFFIYNTGRGVGAAAVDTALAGHVRNGLVTVVPWPYENCVHGLAKGRMLFFDDAQGQVCVV